MKTFLATFIVLGLMGASGVLGYRWHEYEQGQWQGYFNNKLAAQAAIIEKQKRDNKRYFKKARKSLLIQNRINKKLARR